MLTERLADQQTNVAIEAESALCTQVVGYRACKKVLGVVIHIHRSNEISFETISY